MNRLGPPTNVLASSLLRSFADRIDAGDLVITKLSLIDEETLGLIVEGVGAESLEPAAPPNPTPVAASTPGAKHRVLARSDRCPSCDGRDLRSVDDERVCLSCSFNWRPGAQVEV